MALAEIKKSDVMQAASSQLTCANCGEILAGHLITEEFVSPVPELLASTRVASENEAIDVQDVLLETQYDLHQLDNEIDHVQAILTGLQKKRDTLERHLRAHSALLAPIRMLPWEILSEIFVRIGLPLQHPKRQLYQQVLLPGQVCRFWRTIALSTPRLWTDIVLDLDWDVDIAKTWMSRSGTLPLSLKVEWNYMYKDHLDAVFEDVLNAGERWKYIDTAVLPAPDSATNFRGSFSSLETLILRTPTDIPLSTYNVFRNSPRLRILHIYSAMTKDTLVLPWSQLTEIVIHHCWIDYLIDILGRADNLVRCEAMIPPLLSHMTLPHIVSNMRFLKVTSCENNPPFIDQVSLPSLLTLEYADLSELSPPPLLFGFLVRSQISLQKLVLTFHHMHPNHSGDILHILEMLPSLTELGLHYRCTFGVNNAVLCRLTVLSATQEVLLPSLRVFKLCNSLHDSRWWFDFSFLASMALSRCWSDQRLKSIKIGGTKVARLEGLYVHRGEQIIDMATYKRFFRCKNRGLDIEVAGMGGFKHIPDLAPYQG